MNVEKILKEGKKYMENPDYIIDIYDMHFVWIGDRLPETTGYSKEEMMQEKSIDLLSATIEEKRAIVPDRVITGEGTRGLKSETKKGKKLTAKSHFKTFEFDGGQFIISRLSDIEYHN